MLFFCVHVIIIELAGGIYPSLSQIDSKRRRAESRLDAFCQSELLNMQNITSRPYSDLLDEVIAKSIGA